ncbi:MAG: hypothetical protein JO303_13285 [Caulobacteraceae bacterium]|nr:hypothetical protein [Caulobacteraceae bacterium]
MGRMSGGLYFPFMAPLALRRRTLTRRRDNWAAPTLKLASMDFVFLGVGAAMFALFAVYAALLKGV